MNIADQIEHEITDDLHPIDIVEYLANHHEWDFDRVAYDQIAMIIDCSWANYTLSMSWAAQDETLRMICTFDMDPPLARRAELYDTLNRVNDKIWSGGFTYWEEQKMMVYRYGLNLSGGATATPVQIEDMVAKAVEACERFYPAFQLVSWGNEAPANAMGVAMEQAYGRA